MRRDPGSYRPRDAAAYAEGRRLRNQADRRRSGRHSGRGRPPLPARIAPGLALLCWVLVLSMVAHAGHGGLGFVDPTPLLVIGTMMLLGAGGRRVATRTAVSMPAPPPRPLAPPPVRPQVTWADVRDRFHALRAEYAAFECDPMGVLRLPALADVAVPSTARFVDAFAEAQALETDAYPGPGHAARFSTAVDRADRAWRAARDAAERIRLSALDPGERAAVERIIKLLTTARDSDSEPERLAAYTRARTELTKLDQAGTVHVPLPAQAALDEAARGVLPG